MITSNAMQLKAFIKKKATEKNISAQLVMQNYMLERLLERISVSKYKSNFILKGGFLISVIVGLDTRATMDLDTTIKGFTLTHQSIRNIFEEICSVKIDDDVEFEIINIDDIRETDDYPGIRVSLKANYPPMSIQLSVDVTTGDKITPKEIEYTFATLFDDKNISIMAYNLETVFAEKIETILSRSIANTRPRDFYDIYILYALKNENINYDSLYNALQNTAKKRGSFEIIKQYNEILDMIIENEKMQNFWLKYQKTFDYAKNITFLQTCESVRELMNKLSLLHEN